VVADVAQAAGRQRLVDAAHEPGGLDLLVNNAGVQFRCDFVEQAPERVERELLVNLVGPVALAHALLPALQDSAGVLVNVTSGLGYAPAHDACVYSASKAGLHSFTRALRPSVAERGVRVVEVVPPLVQTELTRGRDASRMATPEEVALAVILGLEREQELITPGISRFIPLLSRIAPDFLERKVNAS
jgi:short-subunit dehydrogenase involved in D-alanine esterification of teichoic acids